LKAAIVTQAFDNGGGIASRGTAFGVKDVDMPKSLPQPALKKDEAGNRAPAAGGEPRRLVNHF
jgi:hypothetical protein